MGKSLAFLVVLQADRHGSHLMLCCRALWRCCESKLAALGNGSEACLRLERVQSLAELEKQRGPYHAVVVAAGAAAGTLPEVGQILTPKTHADVALC